MIGLRAQCLLTIPEVHPLIFVIQLRRMVSIGDEVKTRFLEKYVHGRVAH
jgi:hypothetical protein